MREVVPRVMSSSEDSVGDVAQGSQVSREGGLAIQVAVVLDGTSIATVTLITYLSNISEKVSDTHVTRSTW